MLILPGQFKRVTVAILSVSLFFSQCLFAYQSENGFWEDRRRATQRQSPTQLASRSMGSPSLGGGALAPVPILNSSLSSNVSKSLPKSFLKDHANLLAVLSPAFGNIRKVSLGHPSPFSGPVVIHIQDVHMNQEAQWNIRETVRSLIQSGQVGLVALEGATEELNLQPFVDFPYRRAVKSTADYLLKQNKITGPIHAAFTATGKLPLLRGIDDPAHYQANVQAYKDSAPRLLKMREEVHVLSIQIEAEKGVVFSPTLRAFDQKVRAYRAEKMALGDYVRTLMEVGGDSPVPIALRHFGEALEMERTLNFSQVELERAKVIEGLTQKLDPQETKTMMALSLAYRAGQLNYAEFYTQLRETCRAKGLSLSNYPALDAYVRYVLLAEGIDAEQLLEEISIQEKRAYDRLAATSEEKDLIARSRELWLTEKLLDFSLTPAEWKEYDTTVSRPGRENLLSFESFYREAHARDGAMADNLLNAVGQMPQGKRVSILVTGGYHAEGIAKKLTESGTTVISYVPKIEKIDTTQGSAYLSVFSQEKSPLEKLFSGNKLFLGINPAAGVPSAAVLSSSLAQLEGIASEDLEKISGYVNEFHPGMKLSLKDPHQMPDSGWMAEVHVQVGDEEKSFTLITDHEFRIKSFNLTENEERPPFAWLTEVLIPVHHFLQGHAVNLWLREGKSPESFQSSFLAARETSLSRLVKQTLAARKLLRSQINANGRATGWMGVGISWGIGAGVGFVRKWWGKTEKGETPFSYARHFVSWNRGLNASRSEDGVNALVSVSAGGLAGQTWMGMALDPSFLFVCIWFLLFVASHYEKRTGEGKKSSLEKLTGQAPSFSKAIQLFGFYLLPLSSSVYMGASSVPLGWILLVVFLYFLLIRRVHDQINKENGVHLGAWGTYSNFLFPASAAYWYARWSGKDAQEAHGIGRKWIFLEGVPLIGLILMGGLSSGLGEESVLWFGIDPVLGSLALLGHFGIAWGRFAMMARVETMQGESPPAVGAVTRYLILFGLFLVPGGLFIGLFVNLVVALLQWDADGRVPSTKTPWSPEITRKGYQIHLVDSDQLEGSQDKWLSVRAVITRIGPDGEIQYLLVKNPSDRWEFPGGGGAEGESPTEALKRELKEELGEPFAQDVVQFLTETNENKKNKPLITHDLMKPNKNKEYRSVYLEIFPLNKKKHSSVHINDESLSSRWLSYERMKIELPSLTLATRMSFLPEVFLREFGIEGVVSMSPLFGDPGALLVETKTKNYVFRKAGKDASEAAFNSAVQAHLFKNGILVRELIKRQGSEESEEKFILRLGNVPFVLERYGDEGEPIKKSDAEEKHYIALGALAAQVQKALKSFPKNLSPDRRLPRFEEMVNPTVVLGLSFWNVGFSINEDGSVSVSRIRVFDRPHWGDRLEEIVNLAFEVEAPGLLQELVTAYAYQINPELTDSEVRSLNGPNQKANMRVAFSGYMAAKRLADERINNAKKMSPSSLSWFWMNFPSHVSILDDLLRKAPWESVFLVVGMGGAVMANLLLGASIFWVLAASLLAGVLGYSHTWGTYGFVDGKMKRVVGALSGNKAVSWWLWTSIFGALLLGVGPMVPAEALGWVLGGGTWAAAWVGVVVHRRGNREWLVDHLDNGNLTPAQKNIARDILKNLEQRPIRLGVEEFRAMVMQTAETYSRGQGSLAIDVHAPAASLGQGIKLYFVDPVAVRSSENVEKLTWMMKADKNLYVVAGNSIDGLPSDRVLVVEGAFQSVGGKDNPLFDVSLKEVRVPILDRFKNPSFRILQTPLIQLNGDNLVPEDPLLVASKNALIFILESMRAFPSTAFHWGDVLHVYRALAESA
ncbi:MAG: NUDIX domain-containing protein [Elusimicrobia bacterium]|mgnify:CR=1 FL=1|jgi:8-oxo-dGTP pyrophosphatase MutT (NUDIX family)|nr:NUDIX domain-containing protein [Elusimicrobiota bacterium]